MGIMQGLLKREKRADNGKTEAAPTRTRDDSQAPLMLLLPDAGGIATYTLNQFPSAKAAEFFLDSTLRGHVPESAVLFWALNWQPISGGVGSVEAEALVIIRDVKKAVVYPFSFSDLESAYDFVRHEMHRGLDLTQVMIYWAVPARIEVDFWGRSTIVPPAAPQRRNGQFDPSYASTATPAPLPASAPDVEPHQAKSGDDYLTEADVAEAVKAMKAMTADRPANGRVIPMPRQDDAAFPEVPPAPPIDFPSASQKVQEARSVQKAVRAWANISLAIDEALDVYVAHRVGVQLAWNRIFRAITAAVAAQQERMTKQAEEARAEKARHESIAAAWQNAGSAIEDAARAQEEKAAADEAERSAAAAEAAATALTEAASAATKSKLMRKAWLNASWTLEEAVYAAALEKKAMASRAWRNATVVLAEAAEAHITHETAVRAAWDNIAFAIGEAYDTYSARRRMFGRVWSDLSLQLSFAVNEHVRMQRVYAGIRNSSIALEEAVEAKTYREKMITAWHLLIDEMLAAANLQVRHGRAVAAWSNIAIGLDGVCRAYVVKQRRAIRAWSVLGRSFGHAVESKVRQDMLITAWTNIAVTLGEGAEIKMRHDAASLAWRNATVTLFGAVVAKQRHEAAVAGWQNAGVALHEATIARFRYEFFVAAWQNISEALDLGAKAYIDRKYALEQAWSAAVDAIAGALEAKQVHDGLVTAWSNAGFALAEFVDAYEYHQALIRSWSNAGLAFAEAVPVYEFKQRAIAGWENATIAFKEAIVAEAKLRIDEAGLNRSEVAAVNKTVKKAKAAAKKSVEGGEGGEPVEIGAPAMIEVKLPDELAPKAEEEAAEPFEEAADDEEHATESPKEASRGLWRIHEANRWEPQVEPFRGFQSPPGRFHHIEQPDDNNGI